MDVHIRKAVITAAGRGKRLYPAADTVQKAMLPLVDHSRLARPVHQITTEEAVDSGIGFFVARERSDAFFGEIVSWVMSEPVDAAYDGSRGHVKSLYHFDGQPHRELVT